MISGWKSILLLVSVTFAALASGCGAASGGSGDVSSLASAGAAAYEARDAAAFLNSCISLEEAIARKAVALRTQMESGQINKDQMFAALGQVVGEASAMWPAATDEEWMRAVETAEPALWARYEQAKIAGAKAAAGGSQ